jgi:hypothetical protein
VARAGAEAYRDRCGQRATGGFRTFSGAFSGRFSELGGSTGFFVIGYVWDLGFRYHEEIYTKNCYPKIFPPKFSEIKCVLDFGRHVSSALTPGFAIGVPTKIVTDFNIFGGTGP